VIAKYLGLINFVKAKQLEETAFQRCRAGLGNHVLGFELEPVVTMGARASSQDLLWQESEWQARGFAIQRADRGGQATLHNPGQLVIFPVVDIREIGVKGFVRLLATATQNLLRAHGCEAEFNECRPGLYTTKGKIVSIGLRVRKGISTHGISINVHNDLSPFGGIQVCGLRESTLDRLATTAALNDLFLEWIEVFKTQINA
jgi:lipoate-protein ligase B